MTWIVRGKIQLFQLGVICLDSYNNTVPELLLSAPSGRSLPPFPQATLLPNPPHRLHLSEPSPSSPFSERLLSSVNWGWAGHVAWKKSKEAATPGLSASTSILNRMFHPAF